MPPSQCCQDRVITVDIKDLSLPPKKKQAFWNKADFTVLPRRLFKTTLAVYSEFLYKSPPPHRPSLPTPGSLSLFLPLSYDTRVTETHNSMLLLRNHLSRFRHIHTAMQVCCFFFFPNPPAVMITNKNASANGRILIISQIMKTQ